MGTKKKLIAATFASAMTFALFGGLAALFASADGPCCGSVAAIAVKPPTQQPLVGVFLGTAVDGVPVYGLPPITVAVDRKVALARIEQEERLARVEADPPRRTATGPEQHARRAIVALHAPRP